MYRVMIKKRQIYLIWNQLTAAVVQTQDKHQELCMRSLEVPLLCIGTWFAVPTHSHMLFLVFLLFIHYPKTKMDRRKKHKAILLLDDEQGREKCENKGHMIVKNSHKGKDTEELRKFDKSHDPMFHLQLTHGGNGEKKKILETRLESSILEMFIFFFSF